MVHKLQTLLLMTALLSYSIIIAASDFDDGTLEYTITSPANLEVRCVGFTDAHENDESVIIPSTVNYNNRTYTVTSVCIAYSYSYEHPNTTLKKITLPSTLKNISDYAFWYCRSLTDISIPEGVESIGREAFRSCSSLSSIVIPSSVNSIIYSAFEGCI